MGSKNFSPKTQNWPKRKKKSPKTQNSPKRKIRQNDAKLAITPQTHERYLSFQHRPVPSLPLRQRHCGQRNAAGWGNSSMGDDDFLAASKRHIRNSPKELATIFRRRIFGVANLANFAKGADNAMLQVGETMHREAAAKQTTIFRRRRFWRISDCGELVKSPKSPYHQIRQNAKFTKSPNSPKRQIRQNAKCDLTPNSPKRQMHQNAKFAKTPNST